MEFLIMKKVLLLGASGSIGTQTLDILKSDRTNFSLVALSVGHQIQKIPAILSSFPSVRFVYVQEEKDIAPLKKEHPSIRFFSGEEGLLRIIEESNADLVVNALVGFVGLFPSLRALELGKTLCLANKESLVTGGSFLKEALMRFGGKLFPIDSEHVAIAKCLSKVKREDVEELILTGSGGALRSLPISELDKVTPEDALKHPTWKMGKRITIDCATMMNKGFEVIEAKELFDFPLERISIVLHDESEVHSLIQLKDGSYLADIGKPDMHSCIAYALYGGKIDFSLRSFRSFDELSPLHFRPFDPVRYPAVSLALEAGKGPLGSTCVLNAADEEAVSLFLEKRISYPDIVRFVSLALKEVSMDVHSPADLVRLDAKARAFVHELEKKNGLA